MQLSSLLLHPGPYCICRLPPAEALPSWAVSAEFCSITRTPEELSIVCEQEVVPSHIEANRGWRLLRVQGRLDFSLVGVLAGLTTTLANANVSVFAVSTHQTDYLLVQNEAVDRAVAALRAATYVVSVVSDERSRPRPRPQPAGVHELFVSEGAAGQPTKR